MSTKKKPLFSYNEQQDEDNFRKMEEVCDKAGSYRVLDPNKKIRAQRYCLSENANEDEKGARMGHTGALAAFLRLYSGHSFLDEFPTLAVPDGPVTLRDVDHVRRSVILKTWTDVRLRLRIREHDVTGFIKKWYALHKEFSQELNLLAALVAHTESLMDDNRRDFTYTKQISKLKRHEYNKTMLNLKLLLDAQGTTSTIFGYRKLHDGMMLPC